MKGVLYRFAQNFINISSERQENLQLTKGTCFSIQNKQTIFADLQTTATLSSSKGEPLARYGFKEDSSSYKIHP